MSFRAPSGGFVSGCAHYVQPGDVEGQRGQCEFVDYVLQSTGAKLAHASLLFQDSETGSTTALRRA